MNKEKNISIFDENPSDTHDRQGLIIEIENNLEKLGKRIEDKYGNNFKESIFEKIRNQNQDELKRYETTDLENFIDYANLSIKLQEQKYKQTDNARENDLKIFWERIKNNLVEELAKRNQQM